MSKLFLCHSSVDKPFVRQLAGDLGAANVDVWIDEKEILVGDPIRETIEKGLRGSDYLAIVLSPASIKSGWVQKELDAKLLQEIETREVRVLPILLKDCELPLFLKGKRYADFRTDYKDGLNDLLARFKQGSKEAGLKRQILQRLAAGDMNRVDPHKLMELSLGSGQLDATSELIEAHKLSHPECAISKVLSQLIVIMRFGNQKDASTWSEAVDAAIELIRLNPSPEHLRNLHQLCVSSPRDEECARKAIELTDAILLEYREQQKPWLVHILAMLVTVSHRVAVEGVEPKKLFTQITEVIESAKTPELRAALSQLVHAGVHLGTTLEKDDRQAMLGRLATAAESKLGIGHEYSDAYLHIAWAYSLIGDIDRSKLLLERYRYTVPTPKFNAEISKHPPLSFN